MGKVAQSFYNERGSDDDDDRTAAISSMLSSFVWPRLDINFTIDGSGYEGRRNGSCRHQLVRTIRIRQASHG